jgi:hypothetical protein
LQRHFHPVRLCVQLLSLLLMVHGVNAAETSNRMIAAHSSVQVDTVGLVSTLDQPVSISADYTLHWAQPLGERLGGWVQIGPGKVTDAFTVTSRFTLHAPEDMCEHIWVIGLSQSPQEAAHFLGLQWVQDQTGFLPIWRLQMVVTEVGSASMQPVTLELMTGPPQLGHPYHATLSYDPGDAGIGYLAVALEDASTGETLVNTNIPHVTLTGTWYPGAGWKGTRQWPSDSYFTLASVSKEPGYQSLGVPYALRFLQWYLVTDPLAADTQRHLAIGNTFADQQIGIEITWPATQLPGELCVVVNDAVQHQTCAPWQSQPQTLLLNNLALGENVIRLDYVHPEYRQAVAKQEVRVLSNEMNINSMLYDRRWWGADSGVISGDVWIRAKRPADALPLKLIAHYVDDQGVETRVPVLEQNLQLQTEQAIHLSFEVKVPHQARSLRIDAEVDAPGVITQISGTRSLTLPPVDYTLPVPTFLADFNTKSGEHYPALVAGKELNNTINPSQAPLDVTETGGVAESSALDLTAVSARGSGAVPYYTDDALGSLFAQVGSFTVSGWIKPNVDFDDLRNRAILNVPGLLTVYSHGEYKGRLGVALANGQQIWSSWFSPFLASERWVFFAFTYDGTKSKDNAAIYMGTEHGPIDLDQIVTITPGQLRPRVKDIVIGSTGRTGSSAFSGGLDHIRIDVAADAGAAFSMAQVEAIRQSALSDAWLQAQAEQKAAAEREQELLYQQLLATHWNKQLNIVQVDAATRVYPDLAPEPMQYPVPLSVPRGASLPLHFVVMAQKPGIYDVTVSAVTGPQGELSAEHIHIYEVLPVMVEANSNGGSRTSVTSKPPYMWMETYVRKAPFEAFEALMPNNRLHLTPGRYQAVLVDIDVPPDAAPGQYHGQISIGSDEFRTTAPFTFTVHKTQAPDQYRLSSVHWLQVEPENLTNGPIPPWWSEEHWALLREAGRQLRRYGNDTVLTPLLDGDYPLIQTIREKDGGYTFDFSRFDRWMEMFFELGYRYMAGHHLLMMKPVYVKDAATQLTTILSPSNRTEWYAFLPTFMSALHTHLEERGWTRNFLQHVLDEPRDPDSYRIVSEMVRNYMPGVRTIDAINGNPTIYSPMLDVHVFAIASLAARQDLAAGRLTSGKQNWLYHCASPYPPMPNTHLDERAVNVRLYPWLAYLYNAEGYLFWGANMYRGADPYKTSIGPVPGGSQNPGHQPGDNWFFYPGPEGLRGSMRIVQFREGTLDHTLLSMLAEHDRALADQIMGQIARNLVDYATEASSYHAARKQLLEALDALF